MATLDISKEGLRFIFCGGKGGVGKTTVSASIGLYLAERGEKTLVFSTDPAHSLSDIFKQEIGNKITQLDDVGNLYGMEVSAEEALKEIKERYNEIIENVLKQFSRGVDMPFERQLLHDLMDLTPPGLDELMALAKLNDILKENEFDRIIIDTSAGAHTIRLIEIPELIDEWLEHAYRVLKKNENVMKLDDAIVLTLELRVDVKKLRESLLSSEQAEFIAITIPEEMGVSITERMIEGFKACGIMCNNIIVNFVIPSDTDCNFCVSKRQEQQRIIREMREKFPQQQIIEIPLFPQQIVGKELLREFAQTLFEGKFQPKTPSIELKSVDWDVSGTEAAPRLDLQRKTLALFGGKGGCGKTTCSAATGIYMARQGKKTLVVSTDPQNSLSDSFNQQLSDEITPINGVENLYALEMDAEKLLKAWRDENRDVFIEIAENATYMEREDIAGFLDLSLPGMDELMALRKLQEIMKKNEHDLIILDTAPTGHTLRFLELPDQMEEWVKIMKTMHSKTQYVLKTFSGRRARHLTRRPDIFLKETSEDIKKIKAALMSRNTEFVPVTIPEKMAVQESERLVKVLKSYQIHVRQIVCNGLIPNNIGCKYCIPRRKMQQEEFHIIREKFSDYKIVEMPLFPHEIRGVEDLSIFGKTLFEGAEKIDFKEK